MVDTPSAVGSHHSLFHHGDSGLQVMHALSSQGRHHETKNVGLVSIESHLLQKLDDELVEKVRWTAGDWFLGTMGGQLTGLVVFMVVLNLIGTVMWMTLGGNELYDTSWSQSTWFAWGMFFDPGTQMGFEASETWGVKLLAVIFSVFGFLYNLLFLGLVIDSVKNALEYWRRKRSRIVANGHTILLGWSEKTLFVMEELVKSAENRGVASQIVVLAEMDSFDMKQEVCRHFKGKENKLIQCRQGSPCDCEDLQRVSARSASEIIVLTGPGKPRHADLATVRTVVALAALPEPPKGCIVAEVRVAETCPAIGAVLDRAEGIFARDAVNRVLCLMAVQPIIGDIYQQLMSWCEGAEIYLKSLKDLGVSCNTFGEAHQLITGGIVLGVRPPGDHAIMAPDSSYEMGEFDKLLVLADSDVSIMAQTKRGLTSRMSFKSEAAVLRASVSGLSDLSAKSQRWTNNKGNKTIIIVGWPNDIDDILLAMEDYVDHGTVVHILANQSDEERRRHMETKRAMRHIKKIQFKHHVGSITSLNSLAELPLSEATAILILADGSLTDDPKTSDSACLATTITVDGLLKGRYPKVYSPPDTATGSPRIICEVLSPVIERALPASHKLRKCAVFFHSSAVETGLFTMAASQASVYNALLMLLHRNDFGDTTLCCAEDYIKPEEIAEGGVPFEQVAQRVRQVGDILLGYSGAGSGDRAPQLNPQDKSICISEGDHLIVLTKRLGDRSPIVSPGNSPKRASAPTPSSQGKPGAMVIDMTPEEKASTSM